MGGWKGERSEASSARQPDTPTEGTKTDCRTLDELVHNVERLSPGRKSITTVIPRTSDPTLMLSIDTSVGGQVERVSQLFIDRQHGKVERVKQFRDDNTGRKPRAWARFLYTGEEFGVAGEALAAVASLGAIVLVWSGFSMAIRRLLGLQSKRDLKRARQRAEAVALAKLDPNCEHQLDIAERLSLLHFSNLCGHTKPRAPRCR